MSRLQSIPAVNPQLQAQLDEAIERATFGPRNPEIMKKACERMDQTREELRRQHGTLDIGVAAIRELRGELPT